MKNFIENIGFLFSSLFAISCAFFSQKPLYNEEFINQFESAEDKEKLDEAVEYLKENRDSKSTEIELSNKKKVTIVVN